MPAISAKNLTFRYSDKDKALFSDACFNLDKGKIAAVTGPSGSGKTSLALCLARIIPSIIEGVFSGEIEIDGRVSMVFQDADSQVFLPKVEDELAFGPENLCLPKDEIGRRIDQTLNDLGIQQLRHKNPKSLSGGQKQLVALGGVLTLNPDALIMDETLSQLDSEAKKRVKSLLKKLKSQGRSFVLIEHEEINYDIADEVWLLNNGKLELVSKPSVDFGGGL